VRVCVCACVCACVRVRVCECVCACAYVFGAFIKTDNSVVTFFWLVRYLHFLDITAGGGGGGRLATERKFSSSVSTVADWTPGELGFVGRNSRRLPCCRGHRNGPWHIANI
jgi:hypothetical protein